MKSLLRSYLEDSFAWGCPVCKTAEEELCQLQGEVWEKGQISHNIRRETLKSRDTKISRSQTDYRKRERRQTFHFKRYHNQGFPIMYCDVIPVPIHRLPNMLLYPNIRTKTTSPNEPWRACLLKTFQNVNQNVKRELPHYCLHFSDVISQTKD